MIDQQKYKPIGVMDSGLGGLTVVRELERLLPAESIVYYGDNANCPYGNRPKEEILELSFAMLDFLSEKKVKIVAIACNTISTLIDDLQKRYEFPIVSIIQAACEFVAKEKLRQVAVFATEFTVKQGNYERLIGNLRAETEVFSLASRNLASLVDEERFDDPLTRAEIESLLTTLKQLHPEMKHIILGCTHYPIVQDLFEQAAPGLNFINPAKAQAKAIEALLLGHSLLSDSTQAHLDIFTSGDKQQYDSALKKLEINCPMTIHNRK